MAGLSAASLVSLGAGCGQVAFPASGASRNSGGPQKSALLLPLSGASAELGQTLQSAATLGGGPGIGIEIIDSGSTPETAVSAAQAAVAAGAKMIVGPVFSAQAEAVGKAVRVPLVTLSNNEALAGGGTYVFGVTPTQSAQAILSIAAQRNLREVAVIVPPGAFGAQSAAAAEKTGRALGLSMRPALVQQNADDLLAALRAAGGCRTRSICPLRMQRLNLLRRLCAVRASSFWARHNGRHWTCQAVPLFAMHGLPPLIRCALPLLTMRFPKLLANQAASSAG
ncbi:penicillin-binding protein activator [Sulfitobacter pacificus]|uniref:penicillin-binding protein activator n=1 Tax=Sulfitobacter pacificus TaxID=1499314 RepID=UPI0036DEEF75